jgi:hypothetical protein
MDYKVLFCFIEVTDGFLRTKGCEHAKKVTSKNPIIAFSSDPPNGPVAHSASAASYSHISKHMVGRLPEGHFSKTTEIEPASNGLEGRRHSKNRRGTNRFFRTREGFCLRCSVAAIDPPARRSRMKLPCGDDMNHLKGEIMSNADMKAKIKKRIDAALSAEAVQTAAAAHQRAASELTAVEATRAELVRKIERLKSESAEESHSSFEKRRQARRALKDAEADLLDLDATVMGKAREREKKARGDVAAAKLAALELPWTEVSRELQEAIDLCDETLIAWQQSVISAGIGGAFLHNLKARRATNELIDILLVARFHGTPAEIPDPETWARMEATEKSKVAAREVQERATLQEMIESRPARRWDGVVTHL